MFYVYILRCADGSPYIGHTSNIDDRVIRHNEGRAECAYTINRRPVAMAYSETFDSRAMAVRRERQIKRWTRAKKEALIAGDLKLLKQL
jgi:predicted GIY-YIG superfamily endonuclease